MRTLLVGSCLLAFLATAKAQEVRTTGERLDEALVAITVEAGAARLVTARRVLPLEQVREVRFREAPPLAPSPAVVVLTTGDELRGELLAATDESSLRVATVAGTVTVPLDLAALVLVDRPLERERTLRGRLLAKTTDAWDRVRLTNDATAVGSILEVSKRGVVLDVSEQLGKKGATDAFAPGTFEAVRLANEPRAVPRGPLAVRVRAVDGTTLSGDLVGLADGVLTLDACGLGRVTLATTKLATLGVREGRFVDLSDLEPAHVSETFPVGLERDALYGWKRDREVVEGRPLTLGGRVFDKGLGVHSQSELTYAVDGAYRVFRAVIGIDDSVRFAGTADLGSVTFRVLVDGKARGEWRVGRRDAPRDIDVDVTGAKRVTLVADYGDFLHVLGRADWADAHFVK